MGGSQWPYPAERHHLAAVPTAAIHGPKLHPCCNVVFTASRDGDYHTNRTLYRSQFWRNGVYLCPTGRRSSICGNGVSVTRVRIFNGDPQPGERLAYHPNFRPDGRPFPLGSHSDKSPGSKQRFRFHHSWLNFSPGKSIGNVYGGGSRNIECASPMVIQPDPGESCERCIYGSVVNSE